MPPGISHKRRTNASISIAERILETRGYHILDTSVKVEKEGEEIAEIDILAKDPNGNCVAVEVKSGYADITAVRQAYTNAVVAECKPILVARGRGSQNVDKLASELGVELIILDDLILTDPIELRILIEDACSTIIKTLNTRQPECIEPIDPQTEYLLRILAASWSPEIASQLAKTKPCLSKLVRHKNTASTTARNILKQYK